MKSKVITTISVLFMAVTLFSAGRQFAEPDIDDTHTITDLEMREIISAMEFLDQYTPKDDASDGISVSWNTSSMVYSSMSQKPKRTRADALRDQAIEYAQRAAQMNKQADISEAEQLQLTKIRRIILKWRVRFNASNQH